jgi:hypothetical protein
MLDHTEFLKSIVEEAKNPEPVVGMSAVAKPVDKVTKKYVNGYDLKYRWDPKEYMWRISMGRHVSIPKDTSIRLSLEPIDANWTEAQVPDLKWHAETNSDFWCSTITKMFSFKPIVVSSHLKSTLVIENTSGKDQMLHKNELIATISLQTNKEGIPEDSLKKQLLLITTCMKALPLDALLAAEAIKEMYDKVLVAFGGLQHSQKKNQILNVFLHAKLWGKIACKI